MATKTTTNPYLDAYKQSTQQIKNNYAAQSNAATQRKNEYVKTLNSNDAAWRQGQSELRDAYLQNMATKEATAKQQSNAQYDQNAKTNYINYMRAQKNLPEQLNSLGIRGGASESSLIRMGANYGTNVANNEAARAQALDSIAQQYADAINDYEMQYRQALLSRDDAKANQIASYLDSWNKELSDIAAGQNEALTNAYVTALQNDIEYKDAQNRWNYEKSRDAIADARYATEYKDARQAKFLEQYAAGLARYTKVETLNKLLANITKDANWYKDAFKYGKVQAIKARIGEIKAAK